MTACSWSRRRRRRIVVLLTSLLLVGCGAAPAPAPPIAPSPDGRASVMDVVRRPGGGPVIARDGTPAAGSPLASAPPGQTPAVLATATGIPTPFTNSQTIEWERFGPRFGAGVRVTF